MQEFRVVWCKYPSNFNDNRVLFITTETKADARALANDHVERRYGISRRDFGIVDVSEAQPVPAGTVREG